MAKRATTLSTEVIESARASLIELKSQVPSVEGALESLKGEIQSLVDAGFSRAEVTAKLNELGIACKQYQLAKLLRKQRSPKATDK